jgi:hypothetical protein
MPESDQVYVPLELRNQSENWVSSPAISQYFSGFLERQSLDGAPVSCYCRSPSTSMRRGVLSVCIRICGAVENAIT